MENSVIDINEQRAAAAFTKQSQVFDDLYSGNAIFQYKRQRVRKHVMQYMKPGCSILELNSGTGEDAAWFAKQGFSVHATDISAGMQQVLKEKTVVEAAEGKITFELCSFTRLETLKKKGPYDIIFSNFAGLNCTAHLDRVLHSFDPLLKPGGIATLVILPSFCLWETLLLLKGKFRTAFRRWFSNKGVIARVEGQSFKCWYYNPSYVLKNLPAGFKKLSVEGLCVFVPPSYIENFSEQHARWYQWLQKKEDQHKCSWPWKNIGDYYIITVQKNGRADSE